MVKEMWDTFDGTFGTKGNIAFTMDVFKNIIKMCSTTSPFHTTFLSIGGFDFPLIASCFIF
ncbi:unnamed protein product [Spirodela intermedia]|uniref:Uncharacterized protein n=1 Tax=Spirodela intermedia TaxID=51605 RepID=A0A7I8L516_SPIIN|nr:unnamed protein product [Spirodela intermedia]